MNIPSSAPSALGRYNSRGRYTTPRRAVRTVPTIPPLQSILSTPIEGAEFSPGQIVELSRYILRTLPTLPGDDLNGFLYTLFNDGSVVTAYMRTLEVREVDGFRLYLPFDLAWQAGVRAHGSELLLPHEKPLAWVGAFAYSAGRFVRSNPEHGGASAAHALDAQQARYMRYLVLADALNNLRKRNSAMGETLAVALGLTNSHECDPDQVARIGAAVRLANMRIESIWEQSRG